TRVEKASPSPSGSGPREETHQTPTANSETIAIDVEIRLKRSQRRKPDLFPSPLWGGVRGGGPSMWRCCAPSRHPPPRPSPARGEGADRVCGSRRSHVTGVFSLRHLDRAGGGAAKAVGPIHVLHVGLWMHVASGRDRAYHIGDGEHRRIVALAFEGRAEAVIAELRIHRNLRIRDPGEGAGVAGRDQPR